MVVQLVLNGVDIPCRNARQNMALWALVATKVVKLAQEHAMSTHGADAVTNVEDTKHILSIKKTSLEKKSRDVFFIGSPLFILKDIVI